MNPAGVDAASFTPLQPIVELVLPPDVWTPRQKSPSQGSEDRNRLQPVLTGVAVSADLATTQTRKEPRRVFWNQCVAPTCPLGLAPQFASQMIQSRVPPRSWGHVFLKATRTGALKLRFLGPGGRARAAGRGQPGAQGPSRVHHSCLPWQAPSYTMYSGIGTLDFFFFSWFVNRIVQKSMQINSPHQNVLS